MVWKIRDIPDEKRDELIAKRILKSNINLENITTDTISPKLLTKYLSYTKQFHPIPTEEAQHMMFQYYIDMRKKRNGAVDNNDDFTITARQFEAILRIATARAEILLKNTVDENDVKRAIEIMNEMFQDTAIDPTTGQIDFATTHTGHSKNEMTKITLFKDIMEGLVPKGYGLGASYKEIIDEMTKSGKWSDDESTMQKFFQERIKDSTIYKSGPDERYKIT